MKELDEGLYKLIPNIINLICLERFGKFVMKREDFISLWTLRNEIKITDRQPIQSSSIALLEFLEGENIEEVFVNQLYTDAFALLIITDLKHKKFFGYLYRGYPPPEQVINYLDSKISN